MQVLDYRVPSDARKAHVPNRWVLGGFGTIPVVQALGKYMTIHYLDPWGNFRTCFGIAG